MALRQRITFAVTTASGTAIGDASTAVPLDAYQPSFKVAFGVVKDGNGDVTFQVQHTFDDMQTGASAWFSHTGVSAGTASLHGSYDHPITGIRLQGVSASASARLRMTVIQGV